MIVSVGSAVEIARILATVQLRYEFRLLSQQTVPVDADEERVLLDFLRAGCSEPIQRVLEQQLSDEIFCIVGRSPVVVGWPFDNV